MKEIKPVDHQFYAHPINPEDIAAPELKEEFFTAAFPYGVLEYKRWSFDGIVIRHTKNNFNGHYLFENKNNLDVVSLEFNLNGNYEIHHINQVYHVKSRQHNIIYSPNVHNTFKNQDLKGETFVIQFLPEFFLRIIKDSNDTLKRFAEAIMEGRPGVIAKVSPLLRPELFKPIHEIIHCHYTGGLKKLFLLSKSIEILVIQAEAFDKAANVQQNRGAKREDKDPIFFAKEYLMKNVENPPSLSELSRIAGINEYKLKRGFKETFQTTVFGYLSDYRLENARKILLDNHKSISEVAYDMGFSSPQHFSSAFKKKFGVPPKSIKK